MDTRHVGVGGLAIAAARMTDPRPTAVAATTALHAWQRSRSHDRFPFEPVMAHLHGTGRSGADDEVVAWLGRIGELLGSLRPAGGPEPPWPLSAWLPVAADRTASGRDSHVAAGVLTRAPGAGAGSTDELLAALAADLALVEAAALRWGRPSRPQRQRTQACLRLLAAMPDVAPLAARAPSVPRRLHTDDAHHPALAEVTCRVATHVRQTAGESVRRAAELSMLPVTRLHDEQVLVRLAQLFEVQCRQLHRCLVRAGVAARGADPQHAGEELDEAAARLRLATVIEAVAATVPPETLTALGSYTRGLGVTDSRGALLVEDALRVVRAEPALGRSEWLRGRLRRVESGWPALRSAHPCSG